MVTVDPEQIVEGGGTMPVVIIVGCVITQVCVAVPALESVTVTVYVPGHNPVAVAVVIIAGAQL